MHINLGRITRNDLLDDGSAFEKAQITISCVLPT